MRLVRCVMRSVGPGGALQVAVGRPLVDEYLEFLTVSFHVPLTGAEAVPSALGREASVEPFRRSATQSRPDDREGLSRCVTEDLHVLRSRPPDHRWQSVCEGVSVGRRAQR